jgi:8-oxo-dGTP diphosphatase
MPMNITNANGDQLLDVLRIDETELQACEPLTHALVVVKHSGRTLLVFNHWKNHWELAGGMIDPGESPRECARRELFEESGQVCDAEGLEFVGVMHLALRSTPPESEVRTEFGALYLTELLEVRPFQHNEETKGIVWWDGAADIGPIDAIDAGLAMLGSGNA